MYAWVRDEISLEDVQKWFLAIFYVCFEEWHSMRKGLSTAKSVLDLNGVDHADCDHHTMKALFYLDYLI